ncbi:MAG: hypothetical protein J7L14_00525 [Candidatus Diapherotrites archaeon]|nr:hypothetical protein [Candidatus Diapherotrites archaeon]
MSMPIKKFSAGAISVAIWQNSSANGEYYTVTMERRYLKDEEWQSSNTLRLNDIPKACLALQKAYEFLVLKEREPASEAETAKETE